MRNPPTIKQGPCDRLLPGHYFDAVQYILEWNYD